MIFRQLFDRASFTYTYLLASEESRQTLIIDHVLERVDRLHHLRLGRRGADSRIVLERVVGWCRVAANGSNLIVQAAADREPSNRDAKHEQPRSDSW